MVVAEITDSDMADQAEMTTATTGYVDKPLRKQYTLFWGTAAQFSYVAGQVGVAGKFIFFSFPNISRPPSPPPHSTTSYIYQNSS